MTTEDLILKVTDEMKELLISKNRAYGDSATNPSKVFSKGSPIESLCARIDDKLMRIQNKGINDKTEDTVSDLIGYLILLKVAMIKEKNEEYKDMEQSIFSGGFVNINGKPIDNINDLQVHYDMCDDIEQED
jgi:hypothetical protein|tara:strand:+ start:756 stop:1151 length:396 start_codon:yes stop_codon:yes gene_type:complete